jgi:allantoate deiminase
MTSVARIGGRINDLAELGRTPEGGVSRLAYTGLEREAHELFSAWVVGSGGRVECDWAGNTLGVLSEGEPYLLLGSHLDSVRDGGRYDGTIGVVAGLEAAQALAQDGPVRVVAFAGEEGARFGRPCIGSGLAVGAFEHADVAELADSSGVSISQAASELGLPLAGDRWLDARSVLAFLELHIEQGRVLEDRKVLLGVVDAVAGTSRLVLSLRGMAEHSGATPMQLRRDALAAAAEVVLAVEGVPSLEHDLRATVGRLEVYPGGVTTVPGRVEMTVDVRDTDRGTQRRATARVRELADSICRRRGIDLETRTVGTVEPVMLSSWVRRALQDAAGARGIAYRIMPSGAGHDAAMVARAAPAAMLFIQCERGRSHVPDEACSVDDICVAVNVFTDAGRVLLATAGRLGA